MREKAEREARLDTRYDDNLRDLRLGKFDA